MVCGPLVIADRMWAPPKGLVHNDTVVFFESITELPELVKYYLTHDKERIAIARRGWKLALTRHRSWHRVEELLFGNALTKA